MEKARKTALTVVYAAGVLTVVVLLLLTVLGPNFVLFPDAMLPMDLRELALAWLAIGFLPMLLASMQFHKLVRRKVVFLPAVMCLAALLFWVGIWTMGIFRTAVALSGVDIALPEPEEIESVHFTGEGLDLTIWNSDSIRQFLHGLSQAEDTGQSSDRDEPDMGTGEVLAELKFREGGTSRLFLYRNGEGFMAEQPFQRIYRVDNELEDWLVRQTAPGSAEGTEHG